MAAAAVGAASAAGEEGRSGDRSKSAYELVIIFWVSARGRGRGMCWRGAGGS